MGIAKNQEQLEESGFDIFNITIIYRCKMKGAGFSNAIIQKNIKNKQPNTIKQAIETLITLLEKLDNFYRGD